MLSFGSNSPFYINETSRVSVAVPKDCLDRLIADSVSDASCLYTFLPLP